MILPMLILDVGLGDPYAVSLLLSFYNFSYLFICLAPLDGGETSGLRPSFFILSWLIAANSPLQFGPNCSNEERQETWSQHCMNWASFPSMGQ